MFAAAVLLVCFAVVETRVGDPLLPPRIVTDRTRATSYVTIALAFCSMFSVFLFLTYCLQQTLLYTPLATGVAFLPMSAGIAVSAGLVNTRLLPRFGPRPLIPVGMLIAAAGMLRLAQLGASSSYAQAVLGPIILLGLGLGMGFAFAPSISAATAGIAPVDAGVGSAMVSTSQQIGGAIGVAALSTVFSTAVTSYLTTHTPSPQLQQNALLHGYTNTVTISAAVFLTGSVLAAVLFRSGAIQTSPTSSPSTDPVSRDPSEGPLSPRATSPGARVILAARAGGKGGRVAMLCTSWPTIVVPPDATYN
jgi:MFS family permease